jgi:hypothetical protein
MSGGRFTVHARTCDDCPLSGVTHAAGVGMVRQCLHPCALMVEPRHDTIPDGCPLWEATITIRIAADVELRSGK